MHHNLCLCLCALLSLTTLVSSCYTSGHPGNRNHARKYVNKICDDYLEGIYVGGMERDACLPEDNHHWQFSVSYSATESVTLSQEECRKRFKFFVNKCVEGYGGRTDIDGFTFKYVLRSRFQHIDSCLMFWVGRTLLMEPARGIISYKMIRVGWLFDGLGWDYNARRPMRIIKQ